MALFLPQGLQVSEIDVEQRTVTLAVSAPDGWWELYAALIAADGIEDDDPPLEDCYFDATEQLLGRKPIPAVPSNLMLAMRCVGHELQRLWADGESFRLYSGEGYGEPGDERDLAIASSLESVENFFCEYFEDEAESHVHPFIRNAVRLAADGRYDEARATLRRVFSDQDPGVGGDVGPTAVG